MAVSTVTVAVAACFLVTSVIATPDFVLNAKKRSLLDRTCNVPSEEGEIKTGCGWVAGCEDCGESKCIAHYDMDAAEDASMAKSRKAEGDHAFCQMLGALVSTTTVEQAMELAILDDDDDSERTIVPNCATAEDLAALDSSVWATIAPQAEAYGLIIDSSDKAAAFVAASCVEVDNTESGGTGGICAAIAYDGYVNYSEDPACYGFANDLELCTASPIMVNKTCAMAFGAGNLMDAKVTEVLYTKIAELEGECQKQMTEADCLAYDGSALTKIINETYTVEQAIAIMPSLADAPAASGAQGLVASSSVSVLVLLACVLM